MSNCFMKLKKISKFEVEKHPDNIEVSCISLTWFYNCVSNGAREDILIHGVIYYWINILQIMSDDSWG